MGWIATTNNSAASSTIYNPTANLDVNPANETEVTLKAKWRYVKGLYSISNMQQMNLNVCKANTTPNRNATQLDTDGSHHGDPNYVPTKTLTDTRDNNTYTVSKLADGKCWMTQNLRIAGKTITPADSNVTANYTIPASSLSGFDSYDTSNAYVDSDGGFYTWHAATAGTGTYALSTQGQTATASICPKGWRLPAGDDSGEFKTLYNNYSSSSAIRSNPVNLTLSGDVYGSSRYDQGSRGLYWSSTVHSVYYAYVLDLYASNVYPAGNNNKSNGFSVRCIADDPTIHSISTMQQMTPEICAATTTPLKTSTQLDTNGSYRGDANYVPTKTLVDTRDNNTYTVSKLADGKCWMTQNLRIINKTITSADSDVINNYLIPVSSKNGFNSDDSSSSYIDPDYGGYYTWYAATASTGTYSMSSGEATSSICPKNWRLPTGGVSGEVQNLYDKYPSSSALSLGPPKMVPSGWFYSNTFYDKGVHGFYWQSSSYNNHDAYAAHVSNGIFNPVHKVDKRDGLAVRCIAR